ncbi:autotransporter serine protease, partial [Variibacter gotjawalensis]
MKTIYGAVRRIALWKIVLAGSAALGTLLLTGAVSRAQTFMNYDGTTTSDYSAAVAAWANAAEFKKNWSLNAMNAQYAYTLGFSANGVKLGAVDSGIAVTHPEFVNRGVSAIAISGTYDSDGQQLDGSGRSWKKGDAFNAVPGTHIPAVNDDHGTLVSGHIMAANDGTNIMGVAFNSKYYLTNSNGNDGSIYGSNMDYNYFYAAYSSVALKDRGAGNDRVRVINTSWGSPVSGENYDTLDGVRNGYFSLFQADKPIEQRKLTWLDAAAKVAQEYDVLMVWANGNTGYKNGTPRAVLPYFRPELEKYWIAATGLNSDLTQTYNECGISKYWCVATPATYLFSAQADGSIKNVAGGGTSTAAPQVTGALGILMERYPYLGNEEVRTILLTTTKHLGDGPVDTPNVKFGWGIPDLQKAMNGPSQLLGTFNANIPAGTVDLWSNGISQAALVQRKSDDVTEAEQIRGEVRDLRSLIEGSGLRSQADAAPALIETLLTAIKARDKAAVVNAMNAISGNRVAVQILGASLISQITTRILNVIIRPTTSTANTLAAQFPSSASFTEESLAKAVAAVVVQLQSTISASEQRLTFLAKPDSAYVGSLIKSGDGALILTGKSTFTGSTTVEGGLLEVNGSLVSVVTATKTAQGSGTIGGTGTIGGLVAQSGGIVSPGNSGLTPTFNLDPTAMATIANPKSIGTLTLAGNATFEKGSGFLVQIAEDGRSDLLKVMGKTQLNGGLVYVAPETRVTLLTEKELEGPAFVGKTYTILTSGGGVSGTFDAALPAYKFVRADLGYTASDVQLSFSRNAVAFSAAADTANQKAVADAIEKFGDSKIERFVGPSGIPTATAAMTKDAADLAAAELAAAKAAAELAAAKAAAELAAAKAASELAAARAAAEQAAATAAAELAAAKAAADQATKAAADLAATKAVAEQAAATVAAELAAAKTTAEQALARAAADMAAAKTVAEQAAVKAAADLAAAKAAADLAVKAATDLAAAKTVAELAVVKAAAEQAAAKAAIELAAAKTAAEQAAAKAAAELVVAKAALDQAAKVAADLAAAKTAAEQAAAKAAAELVVAKAALDQAAKVAADL